MKRIAIFAHYDRDGLIDDHVLYYLRGLCNVASKIVFVSDSNLGASEIGKLDGLAVLGGGSRHGEYDFGSWKRGILRLGPTLLDWDELILANDSCFAPVFPFDEVFSRMAATPCDVWGPTGQGRPDRLEFLHSYFLVFRRAVLMDPSFSEFWRNVTKKSKQDIVIDYEMGLSRQLAGRGFRLATLIPHFPLKVDDVYIRQSLWMYRSPWLKVRWFSENPNRVFLLGRVLPKVGVHYPRWMIDTYIQRMVGSANPPHYRFLLGTFHWPVGDRPLFQVFSRIRKDRWWKCYISLFGVTVFAIVVPLRRRQAPRRI